MIYLGKNAIGLASRVDGDLPANMNHFEFGTFIRDNSSTSIEIPLTNITTIPKGILVYSNAFDTGSAKTGKPLLGAYAALFIAGTEEISLSSDNVYYFVSRSGYYVNWGGDTDQKFPAKRDSRTEQRGLWYFKPSNNSFSIRGFGTGDYDFKYDIPYYWIAWD